MRNVMTLLFALALAACGSSSGNGGTQPAANGSVTVSPREASTRASGLPLRFTAAVDGSTETVTWTLDGPGAVDPTSGAETLYTPPADGDAEVKVTLTAHAGALTGTATITVGPLTGSTIQGRLALPAGTSPAGVPVMILGNTPTHTNDDGTFTIHGVQVPYDIALAFDPPGQPRTAVVYRGLTRLDPVLGADASALAGTVPGAKKATVSGKVSSPSTPPEGSKTQVVFAADAAQSSTAEPGADGRYSVDVTWDDAASVSGTVHALQWQADAKGMPTAYSGYASKEGVSLTESTPIGGQDLTLAPVTTATLGGKVTTPATYLIAARLVQLRIGDARIELGRELIDPQNPLNLLPKAFSYTVPNVTGAKLAVEVAAFGIATAIKDFAGALVIKDGLTPSTNVSVTIPSAPKQTAPADGATVASDDAFKWTASAGLRLVVFSAPGYLPISIPGLGSASAGTTTPVVTLVSTADTETMPDLSLLGVEAPKGTKYGWRLIVVPEISQTDQLAVENPGAGLKENLTISISAERDFTTE